MSVTDNLKWQSKVDKHGRTTIPQELRHAMELREDDKVEYKIDDGNVIIEKANGE